MSANTREKNRKRMSQKHLDSLIVKKKDIGLTPIEQPESENTETDISLTLPADPVPNVDILPIVLDVDKTLEDEVIKDIQEEVLSLVDIQETTSVLIPETKPEVKAEVKPEPKPKQESKPVVSTAKLFSKVKPILRNDQEYDTTQPEETMRKFVFAVKEMMARYEWCKSRLVELENEMQDILHYAEMASNKCVPDGFKVYAHLRDVRRERRQCKSEIELLYPVYEKFHGTTFLDQISMVQGQCGTVKRTIESRGYSIRTDVLNDFWKE